MRGAKGPRYAYHKPSPQQIAAAEAALGQKLPPSYVKFLKVWDGSAIDYWEVLVLDESLAEEGVAGILDTNLGERAYGMPEHLIAFHPDGHGGYLCFDARARDTRGEYRIVAWAHDLDTDENIAAIGDPQNEHGETFEAWLLHEVQEQLGPEELA
jgi:hypothetical protein